MLVLGKKTDYALISLAWLSEHDGRYVSAREIAQANGLPLPALMQILKILHQNGVLKSTRGVKGGYQVAACLESLSLLSLSQMLTAAEGDQAAEKMNEHPEHQLPLQAMRQKLSRFLQDVSVSQVIRPGRRIDVPIEDLRIADRLTV
ncbi:MAG TPA: Rrf2 family transcriptional regulator [Tepidisphaeraceae bacterium]|jgi:Rrf2 family protein|nr:Rrf2 family transcriptional regulator [Tepidisphaeraceae bacterium]